MKCNTCNTEFSAMDGFGKWNLASGCAASLYLKDGDYYILAHYGSKHDMRRFALRKDKYERGHVCDSCIDKLLDDGRAWLIEDGVW